MISAVTTPEGNFAKTSSGFMIPAAEWPGLKKEVMEQLLHTKEVFATPQPAPPAAPALVIPKEQDAPCYTALAGGMNFNNHADQEIEEWNKRLTPGRGGGVRCSTDHAEIQSTIAGNVIVRTSSLMDFSTLLASAVRSSEPLDGKVVKINIVVLVEVKDAPGE